MSICALPCIASIIFCFTCPFFTSLPCTDLGHWYLCNTFSQYAKMEMAGDKPQLSSPSLGTSPWLDHDLLWRSFAKTEALLKEGARQKTTSDYSVLTCGAAFIKGIKIFQAQVLVSSACSDQLENKFVKRDILTYSPLKLLFAQNLNLVLKDSNIISFYKYKRQSSRTWWKKLKSSN